MGAATSYVSGGGAVALGAASGQRTVLGCNSGDQITQCTIGYETFRSPSASAILDIRSSTLGVLLPRMTTTQKNAIATPATGLIVYDTTLNKLALYTGSAWETITSL